LTPFTATGTNKAVPAAVPARQNQNKTKCLRRQGGWLRLREETEWLVF
jgi:hypothetical protein